MFKIIEEPSLKGFKMVTSGSRFIDGTIGQRLLFFIYKPFCSIWLTTCMHNFGKQYILLKTQTHSSLLTKFNQPYSLCAICPFTSICHCSSWLSALEVDLFGSCRQILLPASQRRYWRVGRMRSQYLFSWFSPWDALNYHASQLNATAPLEVSWPNHQLFPPQLC